MGISTLGSALLLVDPGHGKPARSHSEDLHHSKENSEPEHRLVEKERQE